MQVVILSARNGWHTDELCRALGERGHNGLVLPYEGLVARLGSGPVMAGGLSCESTPILDARAVLPRFIPIGSLEQIIYRMDALHWIEARGVPVINGPRAIERSVDKFYATALFQEAGLAAPDTVVCENTAEAMAAVTAMGDVVIKPIFGSMGHGIVRVSDPDTAFRVAQSLEQLRAVFYVQRTIDHGGRDIRVFVIGGRVTGAVERRAPRGDWRTNVSRGGSVHPVELPPEWGDLAVRAAAAVGADYAGVDLLPARDGAVFILEVNGIPGWQGLQQATGIDVAAAIVEHLLTRVEAREGTERHAAVFDPTPGSVPANSTPEIRVPDVAGAAQLACLLEASAPKPGNVSPGRHFADARYEDFLASAAALGRPLAGAGGRPLGATVRLAVEATACWTRSNTNLGIVLLLAPLARAALGAADRGLRDAVRHVIETTTVEDARDVYAAIRRAAPGGLGRVQAEDVADEPTLSLLEVMQLAADRDGIAREYASAFETTFSAGAPALSQARRDGLSWDDAVVETFLTLLAAAPDTHVARRAGPAAAAEVSREARAAIGAGGVRSEAGRRAIARLDQQLRTVDNSANPGTTADLTAAAIFVVLLGGGWSIPGASVATTR